MRKMKEVNVGIVQRYGKDIRAADRNEDWETAHELEDKLMERVLFTIAYGNSNRTEQSILAKECLDIVAARMDPNSTPERKRFYS
jgi:hypothetical protein